MRARCWVAVLTVLLSGACARAVPEPLYYELRLPAPASSNSASVTVAVEQLEADTAYQDSRIVYRTSPYQLQYYNYHQWTAPPALHLTDYLRRAYAESGQFERVTRAPDGDATVVVGGRVNAFEEVDRTKEDWFGRVELELYVKDPRTDQVIWSERFEEEERLEDRSPEGLAAAMTRAMARIVRRSARAIADVAVRARDDAGERDQAPRPLTKGM